jgi:hypothetical protein
MVGAALVVSIIAAACGGGSSPGVASVGSATSSTAVAGSPAGASGPPPSPALQKAQLAYTNCMRAHGVLSFPDPNVGGGYPDGYMKKIDPNSPQYLAGTKDCRPLARAAGMAPWTQAQWAAYDVMMLKISQCMQAHGITNFPDPRGGEKGGFATPAGPIDMSSPRYAAAAKTCHGPPGMPAESGSGPKGGSGTRAGR